MDAISQTTFWSAFYWMKSFEFRLKFHWSLFLRVQWTIFSIGSDYGLAPSRRQANIWTNDGLVNGRIHASLGLNELNTMWWFEAKYPSNTLSQLKYSIITVVGWWYAKSYLKLDSTFCVWEQIAYKVHLTPHQTWLDVTVVAFESHPKFTIMVYS